LAIAISDEFRHENRGLVGFRGNKQYFICRNERFRRYSRLKKESSRLCPDDSALNCKKKLSALCSDDSAPSFYRFGTNQPGANF
jgi:hypothetical protein